MNYEEFNIKFPLHEKCDEEEQEKTDKSKKKMDKSKVETNLTQSDLEKE